MDPIEKILSELAPTGAPGDLDRAMAQLFRQADRCNQRRRALFGLGKMGIVLVIGLFTGYRFGTEKTPPAAAEGTITYILPTHHNTYSSAFDATDPALDSGVPRESMAVVVMSQGGD